MRNAPLLGCVLLATAAAVGCARRPAPAPAAAKAPATPALDNPVHDGRPVLMRLVSRDHVVTVTAGADGPLYSAATKEGVALADSVTLEALRARHPDVYRIVHPARAGREVTADTLNPRTGGAMADRPTTSGPIGGSSDRFALGPLMDATRRE